MSTDTPTDPGALRAEIAQTRTALGATVEALAAKTDVAGRAKNTLRRTAGRTADTLTALRGQAVEAAGTVGGQVRDRAVSVRDSIDDTDLGATVRQPIPAAAIATAVAVIGLAVWLIWRRRS
jgi:hypothetical protein